MDEGEKRGVSASVLFRCSLTGRKIKAHSQAVVKAVRALVSSQNPCRSLVSGARHDDRGDKLLQLDPVQELTAVMNSCAACEWG